MLLSEIFDTHIDLQWQRSGRYELAAFDYEGLPYTIQLEKHNFLDLRELYDKNVVEASFFRNDVDDEDQAFSTSNDSKSPPVKIYGAVKNALQDKFENFEVLYFLADRKHSSSEKEYQQKIKIYLTLAKMLKRAASFKTWYYEKEEAGKYYFVLSKFQLQHPGNFVNPLQEALIACGFRTRK